MCVDTCCSAYFFGAAHGQCAVGVFHGQLQVVAQHAWFGRTHDDPAGVREAMSRALLGLKCRDGTNTDCLYDRVVRRSELGAWPERFMAKQRRIKPQGRATPARTTTKQMMHSENVARPGDSPGRTSAAACK